MNIPDTDLPPLLEFDQFIKGLPEFQQKMLASYAKDYARQAIAHWRKLHEGQAVAEVARREYEDGSFAGHRLDWHGRNEANDFPVGTKLFLASQPQAEALKAEVLRSQETLRSLRELLTDDSFAAEHKTLGAYRLKLLRALRSFK